MEVTTCEQYVLAELEEARAENERLMNEKDRLQAQCQLLEESLEALQSSKPSRIEKYVMEQGRKAVFDDCTWAKSTPVEDVQGDTMPFRVWCEKAMRDYGRPKWLSTGEFIDFFETEFKDAYEHQVGERA